MRIAELIMAIVLAGFSAYLMYLSGAPAWEGDPWHQNIWFVEGEGPGSGWWPFWLSAIMLASCIWIIVNWVRRVSPPSRSGEAYLDMYGVKMLITVAGAVAAFIWLSTVISMYGAMVLFLAYYAGFLGRHGPVLTVSLSLGLPVVLYLFFDRAMNIYPPRGMLAIEDNFYVPLDNAMESIARAIGSLF